MHPSKANTIYSRFGPSSLHQRNDPRSALFDGYTGGASTNDNRAGSSSPRQANGYGYNPYSAAGSSGGGLAPSGGGYRPATPNSRGQFSDATLNELESQNDGEVSGILGKVRLLKDMTIAIGDEIRDSSALAEKMVRSPFPYSRTLHKLYLKIWKANGSYRMILSMGRG